MAKADRKSKKIAGLKLPKSIRRAPAIRSLLASKQGRKILNDALIAGAAIAAQRVMEAHEAAKSKAGGGKKIVKFEKRTKAEKAPKIEQAARAELLEEVEQVAEQIEERGAPIEAPRPARRAKAVKPAPDAAPVDDVVPTAVEELIPAAEKPEPAIEPIIDAFDNDDVAKPRAAD